MEIVRYSFSKLYRPFWITDQGVYLSGKNKNKIPIQREIKNSQASAQEFGMKVPLVTRVLPETRRSNLE